MGGSPLGCPSWCCGMVIQLNETIEASSCDPGGSGGYLTVT